MKIQCDVCRKDEAELFCAADEAALCAGCDCHVHRANKLASKHPRFPLVPPDPVEYPLCDICQEKRAFLFCQQDRAMLCKDCDVPMHTVNERTLKHFRFVLTGLKLSTSYDTHLLPSAPSSSVSLASSDPSNSKAEILVAADTDINSDLMVCEGGVGDSSSSGITKSSGNSMSEYLMQILPSWHMEDLLDSSHASFGFSSKNSDVMTPFMDGEIEEEYRSLFFSENMGILVPGYSSPADSLHPNQLSNPLPSANGMPMAGFRETVAEQTSSANAYNRWNEEGFNVPQINPG